MIQALIGIVVGVVIGRLAPVIEIDLNVIAVIIVTSIDSILGGMRAKLEANFDDKVMISGFTTNLLAALILIGLSKYLNINLYFLALIALGIRMFKNLSKIRRQILKNL